MTDVNRRVVVTSIDEIAIETEPVPRPGRGEVRVRPTVVGICGSDTHASLGAHPFVDLPYRPGHEVVGVVDEIGEDVHGLAAGDRVVVEPNLACGHCPQCRAGRYNICATLQVFGCQTPGGLADRFVIAADRLHHVPDSLADLDAVLTEPLATPVRAVRSAGDLTGKSIVILGGGPIGLLLMTAARAAGAARIAVTDLVAGKRERAAKLGADAVIDGGAADCVGQITLALGGPADVVFDCVARRGSLAQAIDLVAKGGQVIVVGVATPGETSVRLDLIQDREIAVRGSLMFVAQDFAKSLRLLTDGAVRAHDIVTSVVEGIEGAADAFRATTDPEECKVMVRL